MSYRRYYSMDQVHTLICESEGRESPTNAGKHGHTVNLHADGRHGTTSDKRSRTVIMLAATIEQSRAMDPSQGFSVISEWSPGVDSRFTSRLDLVKAASQGLNGPTGQNELSRFDADSALKRITFTAPLSPSIGNVERFTKATSLLERGLMARSVFLVIDRLGTSADGRIHIHTVFPKDVV